MTTVIYDLNRLLCTHQPSPCAQCSRLLEDKEVCAERCKALLKWQMEAGALSKASKVQVVRRLMDDGNKRCECGGGLIFDEGVIYCRRCVKVHLRSEQKDTSSDVAYLMSKGWRVGQIADMFGLCRDYVRNLAKKNGYSFMKQTSKAQKAKIVEYAVEFGTPAAADKFDLHPGTISRYARQFGAGHKQRYDELKIKAAEMFESGLSVAKVAHKLGIDRKTALGWLNNLRN